MTRICILWTLSTIGGVAVLGLAVFPLSLLDDGPWAVPGLATAGALVGALVGAGVGVLQRVVLPRDLPWAARWTLGTAAGWALGAAIAVPLFWELAVHNMTGPELAIVGPLGAIGIGVGQWWVVRREWLATGFWIGATVLAWGAGALLTLLLVALLPAILGSHALGWLPAVTPMPGHQAC